MSDEKRAGRRPDGPAHNRSFSNAPDVIVSDAMHGLATPLLDGAELGAEDDVPPAYSEHHDQLNLTQSGFNAGAQLTDDGRVDINISQTDRQLADLIAPSLRSQLEEEARLAAQAPLPPPYVPPSLGGSPGQTPPPKLNVVIQIVGSRGDVQPFIALGQVLRDTYGHRVRVATHSTFQKFVEENGLEFFNIGGDPAELMAFMVKNPGLMPGMDALKNGEITKRRKGISDILLGCWRSCIETGNGLGPAPQFPRRERGRAQDSSMESLVSQIPPLDGQAADKPFVADAIIANPPSFAHIHVAEKLGIPLHLMFTMPWSPTRAFPQPLANIQSSNTDPVTTNYVSYTLVEMMTWQGLGDVINRFRTKILDLDPLSLLWAPAVLTRLRIPYTYCWSPALIPKPNDWGQHIDVAGFYFLNLASSYSPDPDLAAFLAAGPPPVYIGFGSIVVDDPNGLTRMIFDAVAETGVRALVSKGWGGLGADDVGIPDGVFMLGNCPHDWLFQHVAAVCHHGGAGTTAAGIKAGKPTIVVPFFGDQPFWGAMVARAGAGPEPIPYKKLTTGELAEAIRMTLKPETQSRAQELGHKIREEKGTDLGAQSFHRHLDTDKLRCDLIPSRVAVWRVRRTKAHLSALAAAALVQQGHLQWTDLKLFRPKEYSTEDHPTDPITAVTSSLVGDISTIGLSIADFPREMFKAAKHNRTPSDRGTEEAPLSSSNNASTASVATGTTDSSVGQSSLQKVFSPEPSNASTDTLMISPSHASSGQSQRPLTQRSTSGLGSPPTERSTQSPKPSPWSPENIDQTLDSAKGAGRSVETIVSTGMRSPMNFCLGLARGFRNAPKLYHDDTVRPTEKVTSLGSGLKIAGKEFGFGVYDGITGLVTQPVRGAAKEGGKGAIKGFGKGIGGFFLKNAAAMWSIPAYAMAGVNAEIRGMFAQSAHNYIVASRISQGNDDYSKSNAAEIHNIEAQWLAHSAHLKGFYAWRHKEKGKGRDTTPVPSPSPDRRGPTSPDPNADSVLNTAWARTMNIPFEERGLLRDARDIWKRRRAATNETNSANDTGGSTVSQQQDEEMELAIQASVRQTSRGDADEDARIEQAIRSSIAQLRHRSTSSVSTQSSLSAQSDSRVPPSGSFMNEKALGMGYQNLASQPNFRTPNYSASPWPGQTQDMENISDEEYQALIEKAVQLSISEQQRQSGGIQRRGTTASSEDDEEQYRKAVEASEAEHQSKQVSGVDGGHDVPGGEGQEDEELRRAIEASQIEHEKQRAQSSAQDDEEELRRAMEESERSHQADMKRASTMRSEEDVIMDYVKRQSLAEEEYRRQMGYRRASNDDDEGEVVDEEEMLKRAIEESNKTGGVGSSSRDS